MADEAPLPPPPDVEGEGPGDQIPVGAYFRIVPSWVGCFPTKDYEGRPAVGVRIESFTGSHMIGWRPEDARTIAQMLLTVAEMVEAEAKSPGLIVPTGTGKLEVPRTP